MMRPIESVRLGGTRGARLPMFILIASVIAAGASMAFRPADRAHAADGQPAGQKGARNETLIGTFKTKPTPQPDTPPPKSGQGSSYGSSDQARAIGATAASSSVEDNFLREAGDRIFFGSGSAEIGARARAVLLAQAEWLKRQPQIRLTVEGHADDGGTNEQNVALSAQRAATVRDRLIAEGVEARRITTAARGREDRIAVCAEPACTAQNRRAVTIVFPVGSGARLGADMPLRDRGSVAPDAGAADTSRTGRVPR